MKNYDTKPKKREPHYILEARRGLLNGGTIICKTVTSCPLPLIAKFYPKKHKTTLHKDDRDGERSEKN